MEDEFGDFYSERLGLDMASYNSEVCMEIYNVANLVSKGKYNSDIASELGLSETHVELIQYILAGAKPYKVDGKRWQDCTPFEYGTSPRGLFCGGMNKEFMDDFSRHLSVAWGIDVNGADSK